MTAPEVNSGNDVALDQAVNELKPQIPQEDQVSMANTSQEPVAEPEAKVKPNPEFEPIVLAFSCNWCSYTSADLAGVNRFHYPACVRVIRFMCSGRIEPDFIMRAFENGADGVIVSGCKLGECHYISGNEKAQRRLDLTGKLLDLLGINSDRLSSVWISAAEGAKFANYMNEFVDKIRQMGPTPSKVVCQD